MFRSCLGSAKLVLLLGKDLGVDARRWVGCFSGVCGDIEVSGAWELQLVFRLSKGLNKESKDWELFSEGNIPELKFGMPNEMQYQDIFFRALYISGFMVMYFV